MQNYRKLLVWQKAHSLAVQLKELTDSWRKDASGIVGQIRRASLSVASNIAEGCSRPSDRDFAKFLQISISSANEVEYQLEYARDTHMAPRSDVEPVVQKVVEVRRMLYGLLKAVQSRQQSERPLQNERDDQR